MDHDISPELEAVLEGYLGFFETTSGLGIALFGATTFIVLRAVGLIRDEDLSRIVHLRLLLVAGLCGIAMILINFLAQNAVLNFNIELLLDKSFSSCTFPEGGDAKPFFVDCYRSWLRVLVMIDLAWAFVGISSIAVWFSLQIRSLRK